jgi:hypothetical protein
MAAESFMWADESTWGTWVAPTKAVPVRSAGINPETTFMESGVTGGGRARRPGAAGEIAVNGPMETILYAQDLGFLIRSFMLTREQTVAGTGWKNKFLPDDDVPHKSFSLQKRYSPTLAESIIGAKVNTFRISARSREYATATFEFAAKDAASSGGTFSDGTAAPAVVDPVPYTAGLRDGLKFYQAEMLIGVEPTDTIALTAGELIVTGADARCEIDNVELEVNFNLATDAYGLCLDDRTTTSMDEGLREITLRFDPNFSTVGAEFYNAWRAGTPAIVQLHFLGPIYNTTYHDEITITLPYVVYQSAPNPDVNAEYGIKRVSVEAGAYIHPTHLVDWGIVIQTTDDLVP